MYFDKTFWQMTVGFILIVLLGLAGVLLVDFLGADIVG